MSKITDLKLEPYYIGKDSHCYTVYEVVTPQAKYLEKGSEGKDYEKPVAHYSNFSKALERVMKEQLSNKQENFNSIQEYIDAWNEIKNELNEILNYNKL